MEILLLIGILVLNVLISIWNCYAVGSAWKDTMAMGNKFEKVLLWCGAIQSAVGFSMPILLGLAYGSISFFASNKPDAMMSIQEGQQLMEWVFSLWYVAVIFPILGSGLAITAHSIRAAYQRRSFGSIAVAGWNIVAQVHNTVSAINNLGGALGSIKDMFSSLGKSSGKNIGTLVIIIVAIALLGGIFITFGLIRHFARTSVSRLEQYATEKEFA